MVGHGIARQPRPTSLRCHTTSLGKTLIQVQVML
ncbi:hypothetical protein CBM2587_A160439 [Cupriavidus taiwanensis]|uniref:Uncharacterized protein n=1 Tax=Cupriavidus taiwanensis TaxID=164546 RepID=A0A975WWX5_9BURK|nr:hypothetical protein CBM2587_A160439 [Cupriavidus taiwanensis]